MEAYLVAMSIVTAIYVLLALGLNLQYGFTGLINFGHVGFFCIGAYTAALMGQIGIAWPISFLSGAALAALAAWPLGLVSLKLRDDYFAIVSLGFSETVRIVVTSEQWLTKGVQGITGIPKLMGFLGTGLVQSFAVLVLLVTVIVLAGLANRRITRSPFGRMIEAIRDNEEAVKALGKDPAGFKIQVLMLGAGLAGIAGGFYAHYIGYIVPEQFIPLMTFYVWMAIIIGGVGRISGAIAGTVILMIFLEGSRFLRGFIPFVSEVEMASVRIGIIGLALVLFTLYRPQGLMGDYTKR
ncbi:branched-chain amino acid ABC transporter permease [Mesorhizobium sp. M1169]|uniref:branched-chain amino acid ABC transporter permease n=1 Tax=Mesorhizobium sp. M1169 TaxID=2957066 RepID=UPI00333C8B01